MTWITCPAVKCKEPVSVEEIEGLLRSSADVLSAQDLVELPCVFLAKHLVRLPEWTPCKNSTKSGAACCDGGFLVSSSNEGKRLACPSCGSRQTVNRKVEALPSLAPLRQ